MYFSRFEIDKNRNTIHLTHNDLDGSGCSILMRAVFKNLKTLRVGYGSIKETLLDIIENVEDFPNLFITDLNFKKEEFDILLEYGVNFNRIIYLDHHIYDYEINDRKRENLYVEIDSTRCGTELTWYFLSYCGFEEMLKYQNLAYLIGVYDLWKSKHPDFPEARDLNRLFWYMGAKNFEKRFLALPKITPSMRETLKELKITIAKTFKGAESQGKLHSDENITISLLDEFSSDLKDYYKSKVYMNLIKSYQLSIKFDDDLEDSLCQTLRTKILETLDSNFSYILKSRGGHLRAFGATFEILDSKQKETIFKTLSFEILKILQKG